MPLGCSRNLEVSHCLKTILATLLKQHRPINNLGTKHVERFEKETHFSVRFGNCSKRTRPFDIYINEI